MGDRIPATAAKDGSVPDQMGSAEAFLGDFFQGTAKRRTRLAARAPLPAIQAAAVGHPDPFFRRGCLFFLDHHANDQSMSVFTAALRDPVDFVRNAALHSLACESCKAEPLRAVEVAPGLIDVLDGDPSPEMRTKSIPLLFRLAGQDARAWPALQRSAQHDPDDLVRQAAADALAGHFVAPRKRYQRRQRRHARLAARRLQE